MATEVRRRVPNGEDAGKPAGPLPSRHARPGRVDTTASDGDRDGPRGPGRPKGSRGVADVDVDVVIVSRPRCLGCGSVGRSPYWGLRVKICPGTDEQGRPYAAIRRRRCRCLACSRLRIEKEHLEELPKRNRIRGRA